MLVLYDNIHHFIGIKAKVKSFILFLLTNKEKSVIIVFDVKQHAPVAELADALDLGSSVPDVKVQVLSGAPNSRNPNLIPIGIGFGFFIIP